MTSPPLVITTGAIGEPQGLACRVMDASKSVNVSSRIHLYSAANGNWFQDMSPENQQIERTPERRTALIDELLDTGDLESAIIAAKARAEQRNREAQAGIPAPPAQLDPDWAARKAWLLDGQTIYGELKTFFYPALVALQADDQVAFSRQRDLLFKALRTFLGDPPPLETVAEAKEILNG